MCGGPFCATGADSKDRGGAPTTTRTVLSPRQKSLLPPAETPPRVMRVPQTNTNPGKHVLVWYVVAFLGFLAAVQGRWAADSNEFTRTHRCWWARLGQHDKSTRPVRTPHSSFFASSSGAACTISGSGRSSPFRVQTKHIPGTPYVDRSFLVDPDGTPRRRCFRCAPRPPPGRNAA